MLSGLKFGSKKRKDPPTSSSSSSNDDQPPKSKYASSGTLKLPTGGLYDPKAPKAPPKSAAPKSDNLAALQALKGNLNDPSAVPTASSASSSSSQSTFLNLRARPAAASQDLRTSTIRRGTLKKSDHQKEFSLGGTALHTSSVPSSSKTLQDLIDEEKTAKSIDEIFVRNLSRAGSRYKGTDGVLSSKPGDAAGGFDEEHQIDMTMFTDKKDRVTDLKKWEIERQESINASKAMSKVESRCWWWLGSNNFSERQLIKATEHLTLVKTPGAKSIVRGQTYIVPISHSSSFIECGSEVYGELSSYKKSLTELWSSQGKSCVFLETALLRKGGIWQTKIEAVPVKCSDYRMYFKSSLRELLDEDEFGNVSNKIIDLGKNKGGVRNAVPQGFSYFTASWMEKGKEEGYAIMVEDDLGFEKDFGLDVISGMEDVEKLKFNRKKADREMDEMDVEEFKGYWAKVDPFI
ncbi:hypothetical protein TrST_g863 [Triparma strigata]|uniref:Uncharacterized protein n=1 Tax=Triparma strigata TaxID=1606541 RepID=A0A9W7BFU6_9STRA|nr:hypothetical protein TrST_g863 [Triparma strigata]